MRIHFTLFVILSTAFLTPLYGQKKEVNPWLRAYANQPLKTDAKVSLFVKGDRAEILDFVTTVKGTYKGEISGYLFVSLPASSLHEFAQLSGVEYIDFNMYQPSLLNDTMRTSNRVNDAHAGTAPLNYPVTGKGVIVGVIDDGCELNHDDFKNPDGTTRILKIWDHSQSFDPLLTPAAFGYGREYDSTMINAGTAVHTNPQGHGTTVTGSAVGNGLATGTHKGVAPNADIVIVKTSFSLPNWTSTIADAVDYIYRVADAEGKSCVINASLGSYLGSHDGLDPAALYIDSLISAKRGRLMVCAAGNSGNQPPYHLGYEVTSDTTFTWFKVNSTNPALGTPGILLEIWADTADFNQVYYAVGADKVSPAYEHRGSTAFHNIQSNIGIYVQDSIMNNGNKIADVEFYAEQRGGQYVFYVIVPEPDSAAYNFRLSLTGVGKFDTWSAHWLGLNDIVTNLPGVVDFPDIIHYKLPDTLQTIVSSWACSDKVITTANYNNATGYIDMEGNLQTFNEPKGSKALTSSRGPTRTGLLKPNIAASGNGTMSTCPVNLQTFYAANDPTRLAWGGKHIRNGGTSMASPVVAGAGALLLELCPEIDVENFKTIITQTAFNDQFTGMSLPNVVWGHGKLDVFAALSQAPFMPVPSVTPEFCTGDSVDLSLVGNYLSYKWWDGSSSSFVRFNQPDAGWVYGIDNRGCLSDTMHFVVSELPLPLTPFIIYMNDTLVSSVTETAYQWYLDGNPITGATDSVLPQPVSGSYTVEVIGANGCSSFSSPYTHIGLKNDIPSSVKIYPNPFEHEFFVIGAPADSEFILHDNLGRVVPFQISKELIATKISLENKSVGIYFLTLNTGDLSITLKLLSR